MTLRETASGLITGAFIVPLGALDYVMGGWTLVVLVAVVGFLSGVALTVYEAWRQARAA